jgi:hypothetical protein
VRSFQLDELVLLLEAVLDRLDVSRAGRPPVVHARHVAGPEPDDHAIQDPAPRRFWRTCTRVYVSSPSARVPVETNSITNSLYVHRGGAYIARIRSEHLRSLKLTAREPDEIGWVHDLSLPAR